MEHSGYYTFAPKKFLYLANGVSAYRFIVDLKCSRFKLLGIFLVTFHHDAPFVVKVDTKDALQNNDTEDDTHHTERIGYGIALCNGSVDLARHVIIGLLCGTHTRSIGDSATEHSYHIDKTGTRDEVYSVGRTAT